MTAHKRRRRWLHVEPVETIRPFRPRPPDRNARLAELRFFRSENRRAITDPEPVGGYVPCCRKGKERKRVDGVWGPWSHFSYETTVPASLEIRGISLVSPPAAAERVPGVPVPGSAAAPSSVPDPLKPGRMGAIP